MKRVFAIILAMLILSTGLTGCGGTEITQTNDELTIWFEGNNANVFFREAIKQYEELYPNIKLNVVNVDVDITSDWTSEFAQKLSTAVMAGEGPDVIQLGIMTSRIGELVSVHKMVNSGVFADLSEFYDNDPDINKDDLYQTVMDAGVFDDKRYMIPTQFNVPWLVTNKEAIEGAGIDISKCDTYNNLIDETTPILKSWADGETDVKLFGRNRALSLNHFHNGLKYIDFKSGAINFDDEEFKKWMEYYKLVYKQVPSFKDRNQRSQFWVPFPDDPICKGYVFEDLSLFPSGAYFNSALQLQKDAMLLPLLNDDGTLPIKLEEMYAINAKSKNKQNAWDFIKLTITPEFFANSAISFLTIPISKTATLSAINGVKTLPNDVYNIYLNSLEKLSVEEPFFDPAQYMVFDCMRPYFEDTKDYDICLKELKDELELYVSE